MATRVGQGKCKKSCR